MFYLWVHVLNCVFMCLHACSYAELQVHFLNSMFLFWIACLCAEMCVHVLKCRYVLSCMFMWWIESSYIDCWIDWSFAESCVHVLYCEFLCWIACSCVELHAHVLNNKLICWIACSYAELPTPSSLYINMFVVQWLSSCNTTSKTSALAYLVFINRRTVPDINMCG